MGDFLDRIEGRISEEVHGKSLDKKLKRAQLKAAKETVKDLRYKRRRRQEQEIENLGSENDEPVESKNPIISRINEALKDLKD